MYFFIIVHIKKKKQPTFSSWTLYYATRNEVIKSNVKRITEESFI